MASRPKGKGNSAFGRGRDRSLASTSQGARSHAGARQASRDKVEEARKGDAFDASWGFERLESGPPKLGWLLNMRTTSIVDLDGSERSALDLYLLQQDGSTFKATLRYSPYFYLDIKKEHVKEVTALLERKFGPLLDGIVPLAKVDLDMPNHLSGLLHIHLKLSFRNTEDLYSVKRDLLPIVIKNRRNAAATDAYSGGGGGGRGGGGGGDSFGAPRTGATLGVGLGSSRRRGGLGYGRQQDAAGAVNYAKSIIDLREYDVPYHMRVAIDNDIRVGAWFIIRPLPASAGTNAIAVEWQRDMVLKAEPRVLAFDIECCKAPLKFPVADVDEIFMISYMIDGRGYLIISRTVVSEDIEDFEYTPKPSYPGPFHIFNEPNEEALLRRFIDHCKELRPNIFVTYNGDFFDWPYIDKRCEIHGISMESELGVAVTRNGEYRGRCAVHMDAFCWVKRDSYLPQGSQGLKAVTKYKLGYDPVEVDPEDMVPFAKSQPKLMASYSVSDAVATYYLYDKYVHLFVFSLATIIPLPSEDVLRKGSGTLCEALLMVEAYRGGIICPNKQVTPRERFKDGHPLESDTYVGGHVESIESGIFRSDIPVRFSLEPDAFDELIEGVDRLITYAMEVENGIERAEAVNVDEVRSAIIAQLEMLRDTPRREEMPVIYHLDVAAMYPNIILTNRLQPSAMVDKATCAACDFNHDENACKRHLGWQWRGDTLPLSRSEYESIRAQIRHEEHIDPETGRKVRFRELEYVHQAAFLKVRVKEYCRRVYKKLKETTTEKRVATVCQRENPFYVNTVRSFRDRRYEYKKLKKVWEKKAKKEAKGDDPMAKLEADNKALVYDSLQLAHKCILNSFYGYVMRRGARWYSMSMAATVCDVGANLIMEARKLVERIGRPLELDTDGIWCILPASFPENFKIKLRNGSSITLEYPCTMLNVKVHEINTNHQYQSLKVVKQPDAGSGRAGDARPGKVARTGSEGATSPGGVVAHAHSGTAYAMRSENSIFFEVDGPYRAMVLPASTEEGKLLKKRYAVFNFDGTLAELKGFELKRRGELKIIKIFQSQVFEQFLKGDSLVSCYAAVADIANHWLDVIESCGDDMATEEVTDLISEKKFLSRPLADYGAQKSTSITCAKRLSDLLGKEQIAGSGVGTHYIIARSPPGAPVTQRAIPVIIFAKRITPAERRRYLSKWLLDNSLTDEDCDIRAIIDWTYYQDRLSNTIRKIITIPAALQGVSNPVPRVVHPDWLSRNVRNAADPFRQATVTSMFGQVIKGASYTELPEGSAAMDIEDMMGGGAAGGPAVARVTRPGQQQLRDTSEPPEIEREIAMEEDFPAWLKQRKRWWKGQRSARKVREMELLGMNESDLQATGPRGRQSAKARKRNTAKARAAAKKRGGASVGQFLAQAGRAVSHGYWQLVEFRATATPGRYRIFALTSPTTMQTIDIEVPRTLIVNTSQGDDVLGDLCAALNDLSPDDKENALRGDVVRIGGGAGAGRAADMPTRTRSTPSRKSGDAAAVATYRSVRRTLPRAIESVNLYALQVPETVARMPPKPLHLFLTDSETRGVYEANSPLVMQCVLALGCVARVSAKARARRFEGRRRGKDRSAFKLSELDRLDTTSHAYLEPERAVYRKVYLYHCKSVAKAGKKGQAGRARSLWAIVDFEGTSADAGATKSASCTVVIANPFAQVGARPDFSGIFDEIRVRAGAASAGWQGDDATCTFAVETVKTDAAAITAIDRVLGEMQRAQRGPTFVLAQTPLNLHQLTKALPVLHEFPVITMESNLSDNAFPPFEWQTHAAQRFLQRALLAPDWWSDRVECARYAHIPVGNLKVDNAVHMADVFFARLLEQNNHVTWTSPAVLPDLGGRETEEAFSVEPNESPTMSNPGVFRTVCIELELSHLAVNTMLEAAHIHAIEGGDGYLSLAGDDLTSGAVDSMVAARAAAAADNETEGVQIKMGATSLDSSVACRDAFKVLRVMITQWLDDVSETGNPYADHLLLHFYRWLCSSRSQLYDPALHAMVHGMMSKVFHQLLAEFKRLGARIVHASFTKIILATKKNSLADAAAYCTYILETVKSNTLFRWLHIEPQKYWEQLIFMDPYNHGGVVLYDVPAVEQVEGAPSAMELTMAKAKELDAMSVKEASAAEEISIKMNWNLASFLPTQARNDFEIIVGEYIYKSLLWRRERGRNLKAVESGRYAAEQMDLEGGSQSAGGGFAGGGPQPGVDAGAARTSTLDSKMKQREEIEMAEGQKIRAHISQTLLHKMMNLIPLMVNQEHNAGNTKFPVRAGSHLQHGTPALELIKSVCATLSLDEVARAPVRLLKSHLIRLVNVREFSKESLWQDPCLSFVLPDVICSFCNQWRDLDLCRDASVTGDEEEEEEDADDGVRAWKCATCGNPYDMAQIEHSLVEIVQRRSTWYQLQDLRSIKTGLVKRDAMREYCMASGTFECGLENPDEFASSLGVFESIARHHRFDWLLETVSWMKQTGPEWGGGVVR